MLVSSLIQSHCLAEYLTSLLYDLEAVEEALPHHPEENALVHSLQAFELAHKSGANPALLTASLLHDIGKSVSIHAHAHIGAELMEGLLPKHCVWLIEHHMDLVYESNRTRRLFKNTQALIDLQQLRRWDLQARVAKARVCTVEFAVEYVCRGINNE